MQKRASGGSRRSMNTNSSSNNVPTRGALTDPQTYGMLLWQSKLQEKLLQEQKEKRQKELEIQQRRARENAHQSAGQKEKNYEQPSPSTPPIEIPQMIPGPAPYVITPPTPKPAQSPTVQQTSLNPSANLSNGPTIAPGVDQQPLFPNISGRMRSSVSCDNFGKLPPPSSMLGNIVSFQQMGGAGSPRRSPSGKLLTVLRGDPEIRYHQKDTRGFDQTIRYLMDRDKVLEYKRDLDRQLEEKRMWKSRLGSAAIKEITRKGFIENGNNNGADNSKTPSSTASGHFMYNSERASGSNAKTGIELAPLMRKFNSLPKLNGLSSTDVTRPYVHSPRNEFFHPVQPNEVSETLASQLKEKAWLNRKQQENERVATDRHFETMNSLWGRPGAGAPMPFGEKGLRYAVSFANLDGSSQTGGGGGGGLEQYHRNHNSNMGYNRVNLFKALHMTHQQPGRPK